MTNFTEKQLTDAIEAEALAWAIFFKVPLTDANLEGRRRFHRANLACGHIGELAEFLPQPLKRLCWNDVRSLRAKDRYRHAGALAFILGETAEYGCHVGMRSTRDRDMAEWMAGYFAAEDDYRAGESYASIEAAAAAAEAEAEADYDAQAEAAAEARYDYWAETQYRD